LSLKIDRAAILQRTDRTGRIGNAPGGPEPKFVNRKIVFVFKKCPKLQRP